MKFFIILPILMTLILSSCNQKIKPSLFQSESSIKSFNNSNQNGTVIANLSNTSTNIFIQAPHSFYDIGTKKIASDLSTELKAKAFFYNTVHRKNIDLGKAPNIKENPLLKLSIDYIKRHKNPKLVQLHGFSKNKHEHLKASNFDAIISNGSKKPDLYTKQLTQCLDNSLPYKIALYGKDTQKLGGTKNIIKKYCAKNCQFIHLEFSKELRDYIKKNKDSISKISKCIKT